MFNLVNRARAKKNKGFSLVELIVVVLIIAIIAVALAPQVMKYVGKAKTNTSNNTAATIKSSVQAALAEYQETKSLPANQDIEYTVVAAKCDNVTDKVTPVANKGNAELEAILEPIIGGDKLDSDYSVVIKVDGNSNPTSVTVTPSTSTSTSTTTPSATGTGNN